MELEVKIEKELRNFTLRADFSLREVAESVIDKSNQLQPKGGKGKGAKKAKKADPAPASDDDE